MSYLCFILGYCCNTFELCDSLGILIQTFGEELTVTSPRYPQNYQITGDGCSLVVVITLELPSVLHIKDRSTCEVPYMLVDSEDVALPYQYINCVLEDSTVTYTNDIIIRSSSLRINLPPGQRSGFTFTITGCNYSIINAFINTNWLEQEYSQIWCKFVLPYNFVNICRYLILMHKPPNTNNDCLHFGLVPKTE